MPVPAPFVLRSYGGGAVAAQLVEAMGATDASFAITTTVGWTEADGNPLGTAGPFTVIIDRATDTVEKITCSTVNLTTGVVTVDMTGGTGRGADGTTPQAHVPGGSTSGVQTCWSAVEAGEANEAVTYLLGTAGGTRTPGNSLILDGDGLPEWAAITGLTSIPLFGVGTPEYGSSPPPRLTGAFYPQGGEVPVTFSSGFGTLTFAHAYSTGCLFCIPTALNNNPSNIAEVNHYATGPASIECVLSVGGLPFSGTYDISYFAVGW
jgi:hypothetical protein